MITLTETYECTRYRCTVEACSLPCHEFSCDLNNPKFIGRGKILSLKRLAEIADRNPPTITHIALKKMPEDDDEDRELTQAMALQLRVPEEKKHQRRMAIIKAVRELSQDCAMNVGDLLAVVNTSAMTKATKETVRTDCRYLMKHGRINGSCERGERGWLFWSKFK